MPSPSAPLFTFLRSFSFSFFVFLFRTMPSAFSRFFQSSPSGDFTTGG